MRNSVYFDSTVSSPTRRCTVSVIVDNEPGVLARVVGLFSGRGYNIESLTVSVINAAQTLSRITIETSGKPESINQIKAQLGRLIPVHSITDLTLLSESFVSKEIALIKIVSKGPKKREALRLAGIFRARVVDATLSSFIFQVTGGSQKLDTFIALLRSLGKVDIARSGSVALPRGLHISSDDPSVRQISVLQSPDR